MGSVSEFERKNEPSDSDENTRSHQRKRFQSSLVPAALSQYTRRFPGAEALAVLGTALAKAFTGLVAVTCRLQGVPGLRWAWR